MKTKSSKFNQRRHIRSENLKAKLKMSMYLTFKIINYKLNA